MNSRLIFACASFVALSSAVATVSARTSGPPQPPIDTIVIHTISGPRCSTEGKLEFSGAEGDAATWKGFFEAHPLLGIHYIVDREGNVEASIPETQVANHALGRNLGSIGIELVHNGDGIEPFGEPQLNALAGVIRSIRTRHTILIANIKAHADLDARTFACGSGTIKSRSDPGPNFPWSRLRELMLTREATRDN